MQRTEDRQKDLRPSFHHVGLGSNSGHQDVAGAPKKESAYWPTLKYLKIEAKPGSGGPVLVYVHMCGWVMHREQKRKLELSHLEL